MLMRDNPSFSQVVSSGRAVIKELVPEREMEYYFPIRNERACWECRITSYNVCYTKLLRVKKITKRDLAFDICL